MKITEAQFAVVDSETSGLDPAKDERLEIGAVVTDWRGQWKGGWDTLVKPTRPLTPDNSAIHGLIDEDFADALDLTDALTKFRDKFRAIDPRCFVAHNLIFDAGFIPQIADGICTKRLSQKVVPDAPNHRNQCLRFYFRGVARDPEIRGLGDAHRAYGDARVTAAILPALLEAYFAQGGADDIDALIAFANAPFLMKTLPFGKHRGAAFTDVPRSYLSWMLQNITDMDADLRYTVETALGLKTPVAS